MKTFKVSLVAVLTVLSMSMSIPGCQGGAQTTELATQVQSLNTDVTTLKELVKQLSAVIQQQGEAIKVLDARLTSARTTSHAAPKKPAHKAGKKSRR